MRSSSIMESRRIRALFVIVSQIFLFVLLGRIAWRETDELGVVPLLQVHAVSIPTPKPLPSPPPSKSGAHSVSIADLPAIPTVSVVMSSTQKNELFTESLPNVEFSAVNAVHVIENRMNKDFIGGLSLADGASLGIGKLDDSEGLMGASVGNNEAILVVLDVSGSMTTRDIAIQKETQANYPNAIVVNSCSAYGKFNDVTTLDTFCDLYEATKRGLENNPSLTSVYLFTDFEDGEDKNDTKLFIELLDCKKIKLFIRSVEKPAYEGLPDYAEKSGGQYICAPPDAEKVVAASK